MKLNESKSQPEEDQYESHFPLIFFGFLKELFCFVLLLAEDSWETENANKLFPYLPKSSFKDKLISFQPRDGTERNQLNIMK